MNCKFKGHYRQFFNCLWCNKKTDITLNNCKHCGFCTPGNQKEYRFTRKSILTHKRLIRLGNLVDRYKKIIEADPNYHYVPLNWKQKLMLYIDDQLFRISLIPARLKHILRLY